jgi:hypothetical protein
MPNLSRKNMPQVKTQDLGKALDMVADKVRVTKETIPASKLKKSQKELYKDKVKGIANRFNSPKDMKPLIISKDNHIVDGHHRWGAAIYKWGKDVKIPVHRINLKADNAIKLYKHIADTINEAITIPIEIGDTVLGGKFKNKRIVVKSIDKNDKGDITINGKPLLKFRLVNEANAVSGGKVHKFITGKNLTFKGKKYPNLYFEVLRIDNKSKLVTLKILSPKELFGKELDVPFKTIRRGPFLKTDTSGLGEGVWSKSALTKMNSKSMDAKYFLSDENGNILPSPYRLKTMASIHKTFKISKTWGGFEGVMNPKIVNVHDLKKDGKVVDQYNWTKQGAFLKDIESKYINYKNIEKGLGESTINEIPMGDLQKIDQFADKKLNPVDVVLTDKHFFDRLNDPRNGKEISQAELIGFFKRLSKKRKEFVEFLNQYNSLVAVDDRTNINIPFMKQANKAIAKTIMRKKDFKTPDKKLDI